MKPGLKEKVKRGLLTPREALSEGIRKAEDNGPSEVRRFLASKTAQWLIRRERGEK